MKPLFYAKQIAKMVMQQIYMPLLYRKYVGRNGKKRPVRKGLILFADSHTKKGSIPLSMRRMYDELADNPDYVVRPCITKFDDMGYVEMLRWIKHFMKLYAVSEYVFICDNFLPVSSCNKRDETTVVQLWHSGGILKKSGYDTDEDIPRLYRGNVYKNYDMVTVSAPELVPIFTRAMGLPEGVARATGISRSDFYFDEEWNRKNREVFYEKYPEARGKKVVMWAPTFRGNAGQPKLYGQKGIQNAIAKTSDDYFWIIKLHPHLEGREMSSNCSIPSEQLLCVTDLLITDYSSILFDYMAYKKPFVLYAPDLDEYEAKRGFYLPYDSYPTTVVKEDDKLIDAIKNELNSRDPADIENAYSFHMAACDGNATKRILNILKLN